jgi:hypothetical protein
MKLHSLFKNKLMETSKLVIDPFCYRQFDPANKTSSTINCSIEEFHKRVNEAYKPTLLKDGLHSIHLISSSSLDMLLSVSICL